MTRAPQRCFTGVASKSGNPVSAVCAGQSGWGVRTTQGKKPITRCGECHHFLTNLSRRCKTLVGTQLVDRRPEDPVGLSVDRPEQDPLETDWQPIDRGQQRMKDRRVVDTENGRWLEWIVTSGRPKAS